MNHDVDLDEWLVVTGLSGLVTSAGLIGVWALTQWHGVLVAAARLSAVGAVLAVIGLAIRIMRRRR